jgi:hypothetical protein
MVRSGRRESGEGDERGGDEGGRVAPLGCVLGREQVLLERRIEVRWLAPCCFGVLQPVAQRHAARGRWFRRLASRSKLISGSGDRRSWTTNDAAATALTVKGMTTAGVPQTRCLRLGEPEHQAAQRQAQQHRSVHIDVRAGRARLVGGHRSERGDHAEDGERHVDRQHGGPTDGRREQSTDGPPERPAMAAMPPIAEAPANRQAPSRKIRRRPRRSPRRLPNTSSPASGNRLALRTHRAACDPTSSSPMMSGRVSGTAVWSTRIMAFRHRHPGEDESSWRALDRRGHRAILVTGIAVCPGAPFGRPSREVRPVDTRVNRLPGPQG